MLFRSNHVVNVSGQDEVSNCNFLSSDKLAAANSKDIFDHFCEIYDYSSPVSFLFLRLFFRLGEEIDSNHSAYDVAECVADLVNKTVLFPILGVVVAIADTVATEECVTLAQHDLLAILINGYSGHTTELSSLSCSLLSFPAFLSLWFEDVRQIGRAHV